MKALLAKGLCYLQYLHIRIEMYDFCRKISEEYVATFKLQLFLNHEHFVLKIKTYIVHLTFLKSLTQIV